jgi:hypothetical protein
MRRVAASTPGIAASSPAVRCTAIDPVPKSARLSSSAKIAR